MSESKKTHLDVGVELQMENTKLRQQLERKTRVLKELCDEDTEIRDLVRPLLGEQDTDGDSYGVPALLNITKSLVGEIARLKAELERAREALSKAIEIIKTHVPIDALGMDTDTPCEGPQRSWPILEEELYYMEEALKGAEDA